MDTQSRSSCCCTRLGHLFDQNEHDDVNSTKQHSEIEVGRSITTDPSLLSSQTGASWLIILRKSWGFYLSQLLGMLWLAPIAVLLWFNLSDYVIGPSAWCPNEDACSSRAWDPDAFARAQKLDKQDRDLLGALQVVAKALEIWFSVVAVALIYDLTMILGRMEGGLPIGLIFTHLEFTDLLNLLNPRPWISAKGNRGNVCIPKKHTAVLFGFAIFIAILTSLANLMGPAVAVLVLPRLSWVESPRVPTQVYHNLPLESSPQGDRALDGCNARALEAGNFSCTLDRYGTDLDDFATSALHSLIKQVDGISFFHFGWSQESAVLLLVNGTSGGEALWVPNRQVLRFMSSDMLQYYLPNEYGTPPTPLNKSLSLIINREGPSVGIVSRCSPGNISVTNVAANKQIRCFNDLQHYENISSYTKCFRVGQGFNSTNKFLNFFLNNEQNNETGEKTAVEIFYSDRVTYFNGATDFGSGIKSCLNDEVAATCNWDRIFATPMPGDLFGDQLSADVTVVSYTLPSDLNLPRTGSITEDARRIFCEHISYHDFPTYSMDASQATNPVNAVRLTNLRKDTGRPLAVDPAWFLAAWSANQNDTSRAKIAQSITDFLPSAWETTDPSVNLNHALRAATFWLMHFYSVAQSVSMVKYNYRNISANDSASISSDKRVLYKYALRHVWAYGLDSRSSKFAVAVVIMGVVCTVLRLCVGFGYRYRRDAYAPVDFLAAALKHRYRGELEELEIDGESEFSDGRRRRRRWEMKKKVVRVRYRIEEDERGSVRFAQLG